MYSNGIVRDWRRRCLRNDNIQSPAIMTRMDTVHLLEYPFMDLEARGDGSSRVNDTLHLLFLFEESLKIDELHIQLKLHEDVYRPSCSQCVVF